MAFHELKVSEEKLTSWRFKMIIFTSCQVAFYKLNIYYVKFTNYHHIVELSFKGINLPKLCENAILTKYVLTLDNTH